MVQSGETAPSFSLPAVRDGSIETVSLDSLLGGEVLVIAFYPGDFNPACTDGETGLDGLDLLTMQKDVRVIAVSGDSVYSHRAFADRYGLHMPLLSDTDGSVAQRYGVAAEGSAGYLTQRAAFVVDHEGTVQFAWRSEEPSAVVPLDRVREAIEGISDVGTAESRYRVGHAHYIEGRRAFTSAMNAYEQREWLMAQTDFERATGEFDEAGAEFDTAARFAEDSGSKEDFERAETKSEVLWRAADWLAESANAFASGDGARAESLRQDAETPLETAREMDEPPAPDELTRETEGEETDEQHSAPPLDGDGSPASLGGDRPPVSLDADIEQADTSVPDAGDGSATNARNGEPDSESATDRERSEEEGDSEADEIDDEELAEITAELEEQTEAAEKEFDFADEESEKEESDEGGGDHGVPDSL